MNYFYLLIFIVMSFSFTECCNWDYTTKDFEFSKEELELLGPYKLNDTLFFKSNLGTIDTITIIEIFENKSEGNTCFISTTPYNLKSITIKHLPIDKWTGTSQSEGEEKKITYKSLISISKTPINSEKKIADYAISFKGFTSLRYALESAPSDMVINGKIISDCYKVTHGYPERVVNPDDIEVVYWTAKYGLTAYSSKIGETWVLQGTK